MVNSVELIPLVQQMLNIQQSLVTLLLSTLVSQTCGFAAELPTCPTPGPPGETFVPDQQEYQSTNYSCRNTPNEPAESFCQQQHQWHQSALPRSSASSPSLPIAFIRPSPLQRQSANQLHSWLPSTSVDALFPSVHTPPATTWYHYDNVPSYHYDAQHALAAVPHTAPVTEFEDHQAVTQPKPTKSAASIYAQLHRPIRRDPSNNSRDDANWTVATEELAKTHRQSQNKQQTTRSQEVLPRTKSFLGKAAHRHLSSSVGNILSKKFHSETGLKHDPWRRKIWSSITASRSLHPREAHSTQLRSIISVVTEEKERRRIYDNEKNDFDILIAMHLSLQPLPANIGEPQRAHSTEIKQKSKMVPWGMLRVSCEQQQLAERIDIINAKRQAQNILSEQQHELSSTTTPCSLPAKMSETSEISKTNTDDVDDTTNYFLLSQPPSLQSSSSVSTQGNESPNLTDDSPFTPYTFPLPDEFKQFLPQFSKECCWDLVRMFNLCANLPRGKELSDHNILIDIFFDPTLCSTATLKYLSSCGVPKDTLTSLSEGLFFIDFSISMPENH